jgi:excisionase family DNA binding protein
MEDHTQEQSRTKLFSIATVAERLEISQDTVRRLISRGDLTAIRIGTMVRIAAADIESFVNRQRQDVQQSHTYGGKELR